MCTNTEICNKAPQFYSNVYNFDKLENINLYRVNCKTFVNTTQNYSAKCNKFSFGCLTIRDWYVPQVFGFHSELIVTHRSDDPIRNFFLAQQINSKDCSINVKWVITDITWEQKIEHNYLRESCTQQWYNKIEFCVMFMGDNQVIGNKILTSVMLGNVTVILL